MKIKPSLILCLIFLIANSFPFFGQVPKLGGDLDPGKYEVGFKAIFLEDFSKTFFSKDTLNITGRPIRVLMWYPSEKSESPKMHIKNYVNAVVEDSTYKSFNKIFNSIENGKLFKLISPNPKIADSLFPKIINEGVFARNNPKHSSEKFPLIVHSLGRNGSQLESFVLWEYLASHGFVVAVIPQLGESPDKFISIPWSKEGVALQKTDMDFTLNKLKKMDFIDSDKIGFIGYSGGGQVGSLLLTERNDIDVLVSLDGSNTTSDGVKMFKEFGLSPKAINKPILNIYNANNSEFLDLGFMEEIDSDIYNVKMNQVTHFDFNQWPLYYYLTGIPDERGLQWRKAEDAAESYELICQLTEKFLSGYFYKENSDFQLISKELKKVIESHNLAEADF